MTLAFGLVLMLAARVAVAEVDNGFRIRPSPTYLLLTPRQVRSNVICAIQATIFPAMQYPSVRVKASVARNGDEVARAEIPILRGSTRTLYMEMPDNLLEGNYTLRVDGTADALGASYIFVNETRIAFNPKPVSVFIQLDKPYSIKKGTIRIRVIALTPTLLPVEKGSINVYAKHPNGLTIRRWYGKQLLNGMWEGAVTLGHPTYYGYWIIIVEGWGYTYEQRHKVENALPERSLVNLTAPFYMMENEFGLAGLATSNYTSHMPTRGNATIELEIRPPGQTDNFPVIKQEIFQYEGTAEFMFTMEEIAKYSPTLPGTSVVTKATLEDWIYREQYVASQTTQIYSDEVNIKILGGKFRTFKPGVRFDVYIAVYHKDGSRFSRAYNRQVHVQPTYVTSGAVPTTPEKKALIIPDSSIVHYSFVPPETATSVIVTVTYGSTRSKQLIAFRHYSESNRYISVTSSTERPRINKDMIFTVRSTNTVDQISYVVMAKGNIVASGFTFMTSRQRTFSLTLSRDMCPYATILVYCVMKDGEVLTDSLSFYVEGIDDRDLKVTINKGQDFTMETLEISAVTHPGTYIAFTAVGWDLYSRGANREGSANLLFTKYALEQDLLSYEMGANVSMSFTWLLPEERMETVHFNAPCSAIDANMTFTYAGLDIFTDANVPRLPAAEKICNVTLGYLACNNGYQCYRFEDGCNGAQDCTDGVDEMGCPETLDYGRPNAFAEYSRIHAHHDSALWAWKTFYTKPDGRIDFTTENPIRPATWVVGAFSLSREHGLAFTNHPARVETTRHFYMTMEVPKYARKGEQIGVRVAVFNYWNENVEALVTLIGSDQYRFVQVDDYGVVSSYAPRTTWGDVQVMVYLVAGRGRVVYLPVLPVELGTIKVSVKVESVIGRAQGSKTFPVYMDGVENMWHTPYFVDLINSGSMENPALEIPIPEMFRHPENNFNWYVPGSPKAVISLVGDVLGPGLGGGHLSFSKIWYWNHDGSGESWAAEFSYNLQVIRFQRITHQLSEDTLNSALDGMIFNLCRLSRYIQADGSISMRLHDSHGTNWVTAFVLETMAEATQAEWEDHLYIDPYVVNRMALWLAASQDQATGAFPEYGPIYDIRLLSNLTDDAGVPLNLSLTAYVTIGLGKSLHVLNGETKTQAYRAVGLAAEYLSRHLDKIVDPFELCIVTYALHVTNHGSKDVAFLKMREAAFQGTYIYWSPHPIPDPESEIINTVPYLMPKRMPLPYESQAVQATAYALLVYLRRNLFEESLPIMLFLQTQRNTDYSFASTQDTIVAMQALREYGERLPNREIFDMRVDMEATITVQQSAWQQQVHLERGDFMDYKTFRVPTPYGSIMSNNQGTGLGLLQLTTTANVEHGFLLRNPEVRSFDLWVENIDYRAWNGSHMEYNICFRWVLTELGPRSGAAILHVDIPSGYLVLKRIIQANIVDVRVPAYRPRFANNRVVLYLDYVDTEVSCFHFPAYRWYPVANVSTQHRVRIFDAYQPGYQNTTLYNTRTLFHMHICQVCGSFQCPYCPDYNGALKPHVNHDTLVTALVLLACYFVMPGIL